jgi:Rhodanese-related sulfurtransferase
MSVFSVHEITPPEAWEILQANPRATLVDVRSSMEFEYVGHPVNAVNIPWKEAPHWNINQDFAAMVRSVLACRHEDADPVSTPLLLICRSGRRSLEAAEELARHGFREVYNIKQGFEGDRDGAKHRSTINGWRNHNLPWEQS